MAVLSHEDWIAAMKPVTKRGRSARERKHEIALARSLASKVQRAARTSVGSWHVSETTGYLALLLEEAGELSKAKATLKRSAKDHVGWALYHCVAAQFRLQTAGELAAREGHAAAASQLQSQSEALGPVLAVLRAVSGAKRRTRGV